MSSLCQLFRLKTPHHRSSHHERNVVTDCDYLFGPALWLVRDDQVGKIPRSHWPAEVTWHQPWTVTGWKFYEKNESQAELPCASGLTAWSRLGLNCHHLPRDMSLPTSTASNHLALLYNKQNKIRQNFILTYLYFQNQNRIGKISLKSLVRSF